LLQTAENITLLIWLYQVVALHTARQDVAKGNNLLLEEYENPQKIP
jgi:hypothetical protein